MLRVEARLNAAGVTGMRLSSWALALATAFFAAGLARAEPVGPWRVLSGDGRLITSDCLGTNASPECLADTVIACELFSPAPDYNPDGIYHEHTLCSSPGVRQLLGTTPIYIDPRLVTVFYSFDPWVLAEPDLWYRGEDWRVGDLAVDVELFACFPRPECMQGLPAGLRAEEVLGQCRPVQCSFSAVVDFATGRRKPSITYIMRQDVNDWRIVDMYKDLNIPRDGELWNPAHWYRK
jgi:hypothetical protein